MVAVADSLAARQGERSRTGSLLRQVGAACGAAYVVLVILGNDVLGSAGAAPGLDAPAADYARYLADAATIRTYVGVYLELIALSCFLVFAAVLWSVLRRAEGDPGWLATTGFGAALVMLAIKFASGGPYIAALYRADEGVSPELMRMMVDINGAMFVLTWFPLAILLASTGIVVIQTGVLPRWLGWSAAVLAGGLLVGAALIATVEFAFIPAGLTLIWILAASIVLTRRIGTLDQATRAGAEPAH
jgi:hypothetical protein